MASDPIERFEALLAAGKDGALLRFGLGTSYLNAHQPERAAEHLRAAVAFDPAYSAAWKFLGKALEQSDRAAEAIDAYRKGIAAAQGKGDKQAVREMTVFLKRLERPPEARG